jgi:dihydroorotase
MALHLRDGALLTAVLPYTAAQFARSIIMPNLMPPVTTVAHAVALWRRILTARGRNVRGKLFFHGQCHGAARVMHRFPTRKCAFSV